MMPIRKRRCRDCGREYELLDVRGELSALNHPDLDHIACPACSSSEFVALVSIGQGIELGGDGGAGRDYPYYDNGLGMRIESAAHRRRVCKERGLVPLEESGLKHIERAIDRENSQAEGDERAYKEMLARQDSDPVMRQAQDRLKQIIGDAKSPQEARERLRRR